MARVHPEILGRQKLPPQLCTKRIWDERLEDIAAFERYLGRQGMVVLKFFLNVSQEEQRRRFLTRIEEPEKNWKFSRGDVAERRALGRLHAAYEKAIRATAPPARALVRGAGGQQVVHPAGGGPRPWRRRLDLELHYPKVTEEQHAALEEARKALG